MPERIKIAAVGCGGMGRRHLNGMAALYKSSQQNLELAANPLLDRLPARLHVDAVDPSRMPNGDTVEQRLADILKTGVVIEISLASQHLPTLEKSMRDIGMPANATHKGKKLTGKGVVIGIIDDGCPFAHQDFLVNTGSAAAPVYRARTMALWDQTMAPTPTMPTGRRSRPPDQACHAAQPRAAPNHASVSRREKRCVSASHMEGEL